MSKLFITDLDGTLLNSQIALSDYTTDTLNYLIENGMSISYSTARSHFTSSTILSEVNFTLPCIVYNGVFIIDYTSKEIIHKNMLSMDIYDGIINKCREFKLSPLVFGLNEYGEEKLIYSNLDNIAQRQFIDERLERKDKRVAHIDENENIVEAMSINLLYPLETLKEFETYFRVKYGDTISIQLTKDIYCDGYYSLEFYNPNANKGSMLKFLADYLGYDTEDIIVFGDQDNDIDMFKIAGTGVAVENASEELKSFSSEIIGTNDYDSVAKYILNCYNSQSKSK